MTNIKRCLYLYLIMQYISNLKRIQSLLDSIEELHRSRFISFDVYRKLNNLVKYKCSKCPNLNGLECRCKDKNYKVKNFCYSTYKMFKENMTKYQEKKISSSILVLRKRYKVIMEIREHLIDSFLDIHKTIPADLQNTIIKNIDDFSSKCLYCVAFTDKCVASDKMRKLNKCKTEFDNMQKLISYNKEGNFTL